MKHPDQYTDVVEVTDKLNRQSDFNDYLTEHLYGWATDPYEECPTLLDPAAGDRYYLVEAPNDVLVVEPSGDEWEFSAAIVQEDDLGGVEATWFATVQGAQSAWADLERTAYNR